MNHFSLGDAILCKGLEHFDEPIQPLFIDCKALVSFDRVPARSWLLTQGSIKYSVTPICRSVNHSLDVTLVQSRRASPTQGVSWTFDMFLRAWPSGNRKCISFSHSVTR